MRPLQAEIIAALKTQPTIDPKAEIRRSVDFLKDYLKKNTFLKTYVLGISGGQDSTLVGALAEQAVREMRAETGDETYQFIAVRLPYGEQADESDAMAAIDFMQADQVRRVNIKASVDAMVQALAETEVTVSDFNKGNIKARVRMIAQYGIAGEMKGAVLGTDHSAESITGFYTKFGDGGADLVPIFRLDKRQGKAMLAELKAPKHLYEKIPTADLEEDRPALPDELALGVTYNQIDDYLEGREVAEEAATKIEKWYQKTAHKRHLPITVFDTFWR
ncbi:ammonia-dependent NAD(+) synthetase [Latilactobacillus curvatus]|jgi:NAD+ synthase|uniref:ammonia-dependent NAD(+) synthetase n=1 Tax=Latilactobacillus curvatus TaxID=28038 RepID=UPI001C001180|nr:ammonia-dependent NAD(+) synthetase [Latilactobacillus curvatus]MCP8848821.1 ammonia-dependent NAD(+) synthetase [Latilactobacillus curvatus]MCP8858455.1 ammonia-dependent NAD(+) synthetase [Latilactobacillus curvatus]MCP8865163.1 ammonia-dependent NAD(+) synthetase [Latilactobacillus curvatus]MCP8874004.1 ammonia-dependent NAD(+) synthetase [Latilactobacillus curvatus]MCP8875833.1 ammonia-dependent NAD(+) synthetase [Latilactobacillus curvatus]